MVELLVDMVLEWQVEILQLTADQVYHTRYVTPPGGCVVDESEPESNAVTMK
jgi:hypothetical protein